MKNSNVFSQSKAAFTASRFVQFFARLAGRLRGNKIQDDPEFEAHRAAMEAKRERDEATRKARKAAEKRHARINKGQTTPAGSWRSNQPKWLQLARIDRAEAKRERNKRISSGVAA